LNWISSAAIAPTDTALNALFHFIELARSPTTPVPVKLTNRTSYRVIYGDTDQMGVVYYANYLRWFERGRSEFLRQIGLPYSTVEHGGIHFPVVEVTCRYAESARYDQLVWIETELAGLGRASLSFAYRVRREPDNAILATGMTKHASVDSAGQIVRIPKTLLDAIKNAAG
jgi:acyl-CoA thioester hydrolase